MIGITGAFLRLGKVLAVEIDFELLFSPVTIIAAAARALLKLAVSDDKGHVWVNLEDKSEILQVDAKTLKVLNKFSLAPGEEPTGLAFDPKTRKIRYANAGHPPPILATASGEAEATKPPVAGSMKVFAMKSAVACACVSHSRSPVERCRASSAFAISSESAR